MILRAVLMWAILALAATAQAQVSISGIKWSSDGSKARLYSLQATEGRDLEPARIFLKKLAAMEGFVVEEVAIEALSIPSRPTAFVRYDHAASTPAQCFKHLKQYGSIAGTFRYAVSFTGKPSEEYLKKFGRLLGELDARQQGAWDKVLDDRMDLKVSYKETRPGEYTFELRYKGDFWDHVK